MGRFSKGRLKGKVTDQREAIAYHEAGHAVISMKLGYKCLYVTTIPDADRLGHVCGEDPLGAGRGSRIEDAMKVLIAASLSEGLQLGHATWGDAEDRLMIGKLALLASDQDAKRAEVLINEIMGETRQLVEHHWSEIDALAQQLLLHGKVNFLGKKENVTSDPTTP